MTNKHTPGPWNTENEGVTYQTGFGNTDYLRTWAVLYRLEVL